MLSQRSEGWAASPARYDDGGFSGGSLERPALQALLGDIKAGRVQIIVVYKIDRLTRSLMDFAKLVKVFDAHDVTFVPVTQSFKVKRGFSACAGKGMAREARGKRGLRRSFSVMSGNRRLDGGGGRIRTYVDIVA